MSISKMPTGLNLSWEVDKGLECFVTNANYVKSYRITLLSLPDVQTLIDNCSWIGQAEWSNTSVTISQEVLATKHSYEFVSDFTSNLYCLRVKFIGEQGSLLKEWTRPQLLRTLKSSTTAPPPVPSSGNTHTGMCPSICLSVCLSVCLSLSVC